MDVLDSIHQYHQVLAYASEKENALLIIDAYASQMKIIYYDYYSCV